MTKREQLEQIAREIERCKTCKVGKAGKSVPGEGNPSAKIVFIGEAPGYQESLSGRPFIGRSGQFLTLLLTSIGINRNDAFITSPVKYYPIKSKNKSSKAARLQSGRTPTDAEIEHAKIHLNKQLEVINPKLTVLLGRVAIRSLLGKDADLITTTHGKAIKIQNKTYFFTYHPAATMRFPKIREIMKQDFKKLKGVISNI